MDYSNFLTVRELTVLIKYNLENDIRFKNILVKGEISNLKIHPSGHWYFTLKDQYSRLNCVMFGSYARNIKIKITEGMQVILTGSIGVYEQGGGYQLYVNNIQPDGIGLLYLQFEQLKKRLQSEGLFDEKYKKPIPQYPMRIGVISASSGAAVHDIFTTITRRWPICERILIPASVQGVNAAPTIVEALKIADTMNFDVIILGRGGGSLEDLWPFNEEMVARAIFNMKTPVVSGVGHEVDFTISDFVSDKRAPTPTGAAEMVTPNIIDVKIQVENFKNRIINNFNNILKYNNQKLDNYKQKNIFVNPEFLYVNSSIILDNYKNRLFASYDKLYNNLCFKKNDLLRRLEKNQSLLFTNLRKTNQDYLNRIINGLNNKINSYSYIYNYSNNLNLLFKNNYQKAFNEFRVNISKLDALSPLKIMSRGYSLVTKDENIIKDISDISIDDTLNIKIKDGNIDAKVIKIYKEK